jgi:AcrR family transcriptional regulator
LYRKVGLHIRTRTAKLRKVNRTQHRDVPGTKGKNKRKEESTQSMSTVEGKKQEKRRALLDAAYELFLERGTAKTSVEDITSRAKVAKGTFYLYFQDKGAVMQALLGRVSYQLLSEACMAVEQQTELQTFPDKMVAVIDHIIEALRRDTLVLKFLERNFVWPGLDQIEASRDAEPLMRKLLTVVMSSPEMVGRTEREIYQRITALGSMCMSVCYSSILEGKPDDIEAMKPVLYDIIHKALAVQK